MLHLGLGGIILILLLLVCIGGPQAVLRFLGGVGCLILIALALVALGVAWGSWLEQSERAHPTTLNSAPSATPDYPLIDQGAEYDEFARTHPPGSKFIWACDHLLWQTDEHGRPVPAK